MTKVIPNQINTYALPKKDWLELEQHLQAIQDITARAVVVNTDGLDEPVAALAWKHNAYIAEVNK